MGIRPARLLVGLAAAWFIGCSGAATPAPSGWTYGPGEAAGDELAALIEDIAAADGYVYDPHDNVGVNSIAGIKIIQAPDGQFVGVYGHWEEDARQFRTYVGTSDDLLTWTRRAELGRNASQPTIAAASDAGYVVGWEQEPPNHLLFAYYPTLDDLFADRPAKEYEPPTQLSPNCAEGTPSFYSASSTFLDVGFHYFRDCERDVQARGTTDWRTWSSMPQPELDAAIERQGVNGGHGDRDGPFVFRGYEFMLFEGMRDPPRWETFRIFLYDRLIGSARQLDMNTHGGSRAFTNPTINQVTLDGRQAVVVSMFIPTEAGAAGEVGGVIYYRFLD
jgi:hypothetical protein